jgi:RHS repeat-associated protein
VYEYDVLGNRKAVVKDGQRTEYLVDPSGLANFTAEYDGAVTLLANYTQGLGLASRVDAASSSFFYNMDAIGSTAELTAPGGGIVSEHSYLPFGEVLHETGSAVNPFKFVGGAGVMDDGHDLYFMRARFYISDQGRFTQPDPIRLEAGDSNFYRYVENNPVDAVDPSGLTLKGPESCERRSGVLVRGYGDPSQPICIYPNPDPTDCEENGGIYISGNNCAEAIKRPPPPQPKRPFDHCDYVVAHFQNPKLGPVAHGALGAMFAPSLVGPLLPFVILPCTPRLPFPLPPGVPGPGGGGGVTGSIDPNEKLGAAGFGHEGFIAEDIAIPYRVNFENLGPGTVPTPAQPATAPAQRVVVTDQLSANLDWSTFEFTEFGFGDTIVVLENTAAYEFRSLPMSHNGQDFNVDVELSFDPVTGMVRVVLQSINPDTELPPDVLTGFLPPEDGTGRGKGYIAFRVQPVSGLASGTELRNVALIKFDVNDVIATNQIDP